MFLPFTRGSSNKRRCATSPAVRRAALRSLDVMVKSSSHTKRVCCSAAEEDTQGREDWAGWVDWVEWRWRSLYVDSRVLETCDTSCSWLDDGVVRTVMKSVSVI